MRTELASTSDTYGIPSRAVHDLIDSLEQQGLDPHALVISRRVGDAWVDAVRCAWRPFDTEQPALVYSVSKTFTAVAIGFLEAEGELRLDDSVGEILGLPDPHGITVRHLLTMNTGHDPEQIDRLQFDVRALLTVPPAAHPGTSFAYNSDATFALSCIVTALTGERLTDYLRPRLLDPLGIGRRWMKPARGVEQGFSGFHLTVDDIARLARVLADGGRLEGQQLIPAGYVDELARAWSDTRDHSQSGDEVNDWALGYGYQVWRSTHGFRLDGAYGQFGLVLPEQGIVIAYQGSTTQTQLTLSAMWRLVDAIGELPAQAATADSTGAAAAEVDVLDSWTARDTFVADPNGVVDARDWTLGARGTGWTLTVPGAGEIHVGADGWQRSVVRLDAPGDPGGAVVTSPPVEDGTHVVVAARGVQDGDGIVCHLVVPTSPHRLIVRADAAGRLTAQWHTVPLQGPTLSTLAVPEWVIAGG